MYSGRWDAGMGFVGEVGLLRGGNKNGNEPEGEAWFVEGRVRKGIFASRRSVCSQTSVYTLFGDQLMIYTNLPLQTPRVITRQPHLCILLRTKHIQRLQVARRQVLCTLGQAIRFVCSQGKCVK